MKLKFLMALAVGLLIFNQTASAQVIGTNTEQFCKNLKFNTLKCFNQARAQFKNQTNALEYLKNYLHEKNLQTEVCGGLEKVMADVEKTLKANPQDCALVSVTVDCCTNNAAKQYSVRALRFEGMGDDALQSLAPTIYASSMFSVTNSPAKDFNYDTNLSHLICFGMDDGQIKATPIFMPALRYTLVAAISDMQKAQGLPLRPAPPSNLRIQISP